MPHDNARPSVPDPGTYRRRRFVAFVVLPVSVALLVWAIVAGGRGGPPGRAGQSVASTTEPSAEPSGKKQGRPRSRPTVTVTVTAKPTSQVTVTATPKREVTRCRDVPIGVSLQLDADAYGKHEKPKLTTKITPNKRCWIDPDRLQLVITSGNDRIWASTDCPNRLHGHVSGGTGKGARPQRITPKYPYRSAVTWPRTRSNPALCGKKGTAAKPGWYVAVASLGEAESTKRVFRLE